MPLEGKRVVITGAGSGIGRALALAADRRGMVIAGFGRRPEALEATLALLTPDRGHMAIAGDVTVAADRTRLIAALESVWGSVDVLVNNAGVVEAGPLSDFDDRDLARVFGINVTGPMALTRDLAHLLMKARPSRVVNVGSVFGDIPFPMFATYSASKAAMRAFSIALRREWRPEGIGVSYAAPRATRTAALAAVEERMSKVRSDTPERVAERILRGIDRGESFIYLPGPERFFALLQSVHPRFFDRMLSGARRSLPA